MKRIILFLVIGAVCLSAGACSSEQALASNEGGASAPQVPAEDGPAGTTYIGKVGDTPVYEYYFNALFTSFVTEALENEPGYDKESEDAYSFMVSYLAQKGEDGRSNQEILADKTADECRRMVTLKLEGNKQGKSLSDNRRNAIAAQWDATANEYLSQYRRRYSQIKTRDDALRLLYHMNVNEVKSFSFIQNEVSDYISDWYTNGIRVRNSDLADYYKAHRDDFRIVNLRMIYLEKADEAGADQKSLAQRVARQIKEKPEYLGNLARGYNQDAALAADYGKIAVTNLTPGIPAEVKAWAFAQSEETLFEKNGNVEVLTASNGYYVVLCESFQEYSEEPEDEVYESVGAAYKEEQLNAYIDELEKKEEYAWKEFNEERVLTLAQDWVSAAAPLETSLQGAGS